MGGSSASPVLAIALSSASGTPRISGGSKHSPLCPPLWKSSTPASPTSEPKALANLPDVLGWPPAMPGVAINFVPTLLGRHPLVRKKLEQFPGQPVMAEVPWSEFPNGSVHGSG